jgi:hypothetical protein
MNRRKAPPRIKNTSHFATEDVRRVVRFVAGMLDLPKGVEVSVEPLRARSFKWRGMAWPRYCYVRVAPGAEIEWLVRGIAHELRHCDQWLNGYKTGRVSERDAREFSERAHQRWVLDTGRDHL